MYSKLGCLKDGEKRYQWILVVGKWRSRDKMSESRRAFFSRSTALPSTISPPPSSSLFTLSSWSNQPCSGRFERGSVLGKKDGSSCICILKTYFWQKIVFFNNIIAECGSESGYVLLHSLPVQNERALVLQMFRCSCRSVQMCLKSLSKVIRYLVWPEKCRKIKRSLPCHTARLDTSCFKNDGALDPLVCELA